MFCYNCGSLLMEYDYCTACGADVGMYKKIVYTSNRFYNEGLDKAKIRDLSGAIVSLRQSLKFNKNNVEARNLLGLVYFEMGEVAMALSEWIISQSTRKDKNIATDYIRQLQSGNSRLSEMSTSIRKFNTAYTYCLQESKDLAKIQVKAALSKNPQFVKAHLLLALLYMDEGAWSSAETEVTRALKVDHGNVQAQLYQVTIKKMLEPDEGEIGTKTRNSKNNKNAVRIEQENGFIIQPTNFKEPKNSGLGTIVNILIGLVIGAAAVYFLIVPARVAEVNEQSQANLVEIGNQLDTKNSTIQELENKLANLEKEKESLSGVIDSYSGEDGTIGSYDQLAQIAASYILNQDNDQAADSLDELRMTVDADAMSEGYQGLYNAILALIGPELAEKYYISGSDYYRTREFEKAIEDLTKAYYYNTSNEEALYNIANSYKELGNYEEARTVYEQVIYNFPDTELAYRSQQLINEITAN